MKNVLNCTKKNMEKTKKESKKDLIGAVLRVNDAKNKKTEFFVDW